MRVVHDLSEVADREKPLVLAAGSFDGVHRGHQAVVRSAVECAARLNGEAWVLTFDPHPMKALAPSRAPALLTSTEHKVRRLNALGIAGCVVLPFTPEFARREPEDFLRQLKDELPGLRHMVVGANWTFGFRARGTPALLQAAAPRLGFSAGVVDSILWDGAPISSTRIRRDVVHGNLDAVAAMLGRPFSVWGPVVEGRRVGRVLGFPTANVVPHTEVLPPPGVYAGYAIRRDSPIAGVAFLPDRGHLSEGFVEIHFFDFDEDIYGETLEVFLPLHVRPPQTFPDRPALIQAIAADVAKVRDLVPAFLPQN